MADWILFLCGLSALFWLFILLMPWQAWRINEVLEADADAVDHLDLSALTVVIPARNEAEVIGETLLALTRQGKNLRVILVDDHSTDGTAEIARQLGLEHLTIIQGRPLPRAWSGKLWAQEQGLAAVQTPLTLLLDADIKLAPGLIKSLVVKQESKGLHFVSLMAALRFEAFWEKLLMPAFIYFFKLLYPFALSNRPDSRIAAAAGGCILVNTEALKQIGGMATIKDAVIDDCTLAAEVKAAGYKTWIGLTHGAQSIRPYTTLGEICQMVARTAYSQLNYSVLWLLTCTAIMLVMYSLPVLGLLVFSKDSALLDFAVVVIMAVTYLPVLQFYQLNPFWVVGLPLIAGLYLLMTWLSALRYWRGERSRWKGRSYQVVDH
ncbi:MAG: glycosyl transferase [Gammaproteobacteria bacterium HGW-Gammaproteobacteria-3]|jgi:hopene-associated glycosyltransferase HpnB|nr:MAG: glycosyl transferase [Gammaproteobacteria bacterium HGW-Gammaproteobacteria-3]